MGQVFKARHRLMRRVVALKFIRKELLTDPEALQRFRREIQMAAKLSHPNVVAAFDAEQIGERCCLVMEYCEGESLASLVSQQGPLPVAQACTLIRQAALGLQHAYEHGLIHRDIKPENLLKSGATLKILDMGLARLQTVDGTASGLTLTQRGVIMGTPDFIAPEQAKDLALADIRSDLYSLGCTFYFLLAGRVPFLGGTLVEKLLRHQVETPPPLQQLRPDVPTAVSAIVVRMMAKDPANRFQTPGETAAALEPFAAGHGSTDTPVEGSQVQGSQVLGSQVQGGTMGAAPTFHVRAPATPARPATPVVPPSAAPAGQRWPPWAWWASGGGLALFSAAALALIFWPRTPQKIAPGPPPDVPPSAKGKELAPIAAAPLAWSWRAAGELPVQMGVMGLALSGDGDRLAVACGDWKAPQKVGEVQLWDVAAEGKIVAVPRIAGLKCVALSADGKFLAWGVFGKKDEPAPVVLWEVARDFKHAVTLGGHKAAVTALAFHPAGHSLVTSGSDLRIRVWQTPGGVELAQVPSSAAPVTGFCFSRDGAWLATITSSTRLVGLKDFEKRRDRAPPLESRVLLGSPSAVALSADASVVAAAVGAYSELTPEVKLWDAASGQPLGAALPHGANVRGMAFTPDGTGLVTVAEDSLGRVWNVKTRKVESTLQGHVGTIQALAMSRDGALLATGGADKVVRLWRRVKA
jgi:tRNA A-37 threonylcarbamoyl transferase component Bud32